MRKYIQYVPLVFALISLIVVNGCNYSSKSIFKSEERAKLAEKLLNEKYGEEFVAYSVGNSRGSMNEDTFTALCFEKSTPTVRFEAKVDKDGTHIMDEYISRKVSDQMENRIMKALQDSHFNIAIKVGSDKKNIQSDDSNMSVEEYLNSVPNLGFRIYVVTDTKNLSHDGATTLLELFKTSVHSFSNLNGAMDFYFGSDATVEQFTAYIKENPNADSGMFDILEEANHEQYYIENSVLEFTPEELVSLSK